MCMQVLREATLQYYNTISNKRIGVDRWEGGAQVMFLIYSYKYLDVEKAGSHLELNPGHLWLEPPVLCH